MLDLETLTKINLYDGDDHWWNNFNKDKPTITTISGKQLVTLFYSKLRCSLLTYKFMLFSPYIKPTTQLTNEQPKT